MSSGDTQLKPTLIHKFNDVIWKIETDEEHKIIALELRNATDHLVSFSAFNYSTGHIFFINKTTENTWWCGLDKVFKGFVFLHGYVNENSPEHKGISAIDTANGEIKWQLFNMALLDVVDDGLLAYNTSIQPKRPELVSPETGEPIRKVISNLETLKSSTLFPEIFQEALPVYIPKNISGFVYYLRYNSKDIWTFHVENSGSYNQQLLVIEDDTILISEYLSADIQKLNPESFFIQQNHLFFIRNKCEIVSYLL